VAIWLSAALASHLGIMDRPGGHKQHETSTPFVGGFGVIAVVISMPLLGKWFFVDFSILPCQGFWSAP
jgi:UDP-N-acetylmuramyl pentapeptide phosphotransferase/UDP-N-acetylglucosamine-1-phosphate transferase